MPYRISEQAGRPATKGLCKLDHEPIEIAASNKMEMIFLEKGVEMARENIGVTNPIEQLKSFEFLQQRLAYAICGAA
jgi:hypothetical protein